MRRIKRAVEADKEEILALYRTRLYGPADWNEYYPNEETIEFDLSRDALFVMKNDAGELIATISIDEDEEVDSLTVWDENIAPAGELARLCVREDMQNQGIARQLLQHGMEELKKQGKRSVHFLVCKTNKKALRSYEKLHFDVVGESDLFDEDWWCYEKEL